MISPWQNPLPLEKYTARQVVVYYYRGRWRPIMFSTYAEAMALYYKARLNGWFIYVFPPDLDPCQFETMEGWHSRRSKPAVKEAIALLQNAITPSKRGKTYVGNNSTKLRRLVKQALTLLVENNQ